MIERKKGSDFKVHLPGRMRSSYRSAQIAILREHVLKKFGVVIRCALALARSDRILSCAPCTHFSLENASSSSPELSVCAVTACDWEA